MRTSQGCLIWFHFWLDKKSDTRFLSQSLFHAQMKTAVTKGRPLYSSKKKASSECHVSPITWWKATLVDKKFLNCVINRLVTSQDVYSLLSFALIISMGVQDSLAKTRKQPWIRDTTLKLSGYNSVLFFLIQVKGKQSQFSIPSISLSWEGDGKKGTEKPWEKRWIGQKRKESKER